MTGDELAAAKDAFVAIYVPKPEASSRDVWDAKFGCFLLGWQAARQWAEEPRSAANPTRGQD